MKVLLNLILLLTPVLTIHGQSKTHIPLAVEWISQSENSSGSVPCGGGDVGLNVWVENGDILFYLAQSGTFDENNEMLKTGRVRLKLTGNPFGGDAFKQQLRLHDGSVHIAGNNVEVSIWVDVFKPVVHISVNSKKATGLTASFESWRFLDRVVTGPALRSNSYKSAQPFEVTTRKDSIGFRGNAVWFFHRNQPGEDIFDRTVAAEGLNDIKNELYNPVLHNTFGGVLHGKNMRPAGVSDGKYASTAFHSWNLESVRTAKIHELQITLHTAQAENLSDWETALTKKSRFTEKEKVAARSATANWWKQFWERSYIRISGPDSTISHNYALFRYMLACNAFGAWPTKFNGGLFTFDPEFVDPKYAYTPDFRLWGGGTFTAQNQRLVYFPMLKNGDFDFLRPQFDFYLKNLKNAELRTKFYWQHAGASFTEQIENFGLPNVTEYNPKRPADADPGLERNAWLEYQWETVFEFCLMMLETERYEGRDISTYIPFIESCLTFYDEHYQQLARKRGARSLDENGHYILYPTSAAETFKMTYNSATVISGMSVLLERLLALPANYKQDRSTKWAAMLAKVPPLPLTKINGKEALTPATAWARVQNSEAPQMYPVYPWGIYGVGKPGLETAINTYQNDPHVVKFRSHAGWRQYSIFAARLGMADEAMDLTRDKFADGPHRFPAFWGPGFDWTPDHNWGGSAMIGLQEMLIQTDDRKIYLLPAWPKNTDVSFKLHAPYQTTVEASVVGGKLMMLKVVPESRRADVEVMLAE